MRYAVVVEKAENNFSAYVPDLPGCIAAAESLEEVLELIREAVDFHLEGMREAGEEISQPTT
jgi:predicted RNase H-like HicB family nuclease